MTASFTDVQAICSYATEEVAYYEEAFACEKIDVQRIERPEDLVRLPLLSPDALQRNRSLLLAKTHRRYPGVERLLEERSLGKLGFYQKTIWDMPGWEKEKQVVEAQRSAYYALAPGSRCCTFHTASYQDNLIVDPLSFRETTDALSIHNNGLAGQQLDTVYQRMMHFSPQYMLAQPCVAQQLAQYIQTHRLPPPPELRYIELTGEHLTPDHRALLWEVFHVHPTEAYSIKGIGRAAYACPQGHLHVVQENAFVEVLKNGAPVMEEEGEIVVTGLQNRAMPLIRYQTGDYGVLRTVDCPCGNRAPVLQITKGRTFGFLETPLGPANTYGIKGLLEYTNEFMANAVSRFVFHGTWTPNAITCHMKPAYRGWQSSVRLAFYKTLQQSHYRCLRDVPWHLSFS